MRLLLSLVGAACLVAVGWIGWRATAETRDWRDFVALGSKARRNEAEWGRFTQLGHRLFPDQRPFRVQEARLQVLDEDGGRLSSCKVPMGPCGVDCRPAPDRGPWAFDVEALTPVVTVPWRYVLVDDRPILVSPGDPGDKE